jgi:peptidoglycan/LPS O-acetylase OafA/YrhL
VVVLAAAPIRMGDTLKAAIVGLAVMATIIAYRRDATRRGILESWPFLLLGTVSYSLYLVHIPIAWLVTQHSHVASGPPKWAIVTALSVVVSLLLYLCVERPTNNLGRWFVDRHARRTLNPRRAPG